MNKKLGYYSVGLQEFDSKIKACQLASKVLEKIQSPNIVKWHFNDEIFSTYNWSIEPRESLADLYKKRAKHLREQYDYIIISYSGGADSHNVVMSFLNQGLFIDELVVTHMDKAMKDYAIVDRDDRSAKYAYY